MAASSSRSGCLEEYSATVRPDDHDAVICREENGFVRAQITADAISLASVEGKASVVAVVERSVPGIVHLSSDRRLGPT